MKKSDERPLTADGGAGIDSRLGGAGGVASASIGVVAKNTDEGRSKSSDDLTAAEAFDAIFWPAYPRKTAKIAARKAWLALRLADDDQETLDAIMAGLRHYLDHEWELDRPRFICLAATWLNQHRWEDIS